MAGAGPADPGGGVLVTWLGNAGVLVSDGETGLLIDPFVSRPGLLRVGLGCRLVPRPDCVREWVTRLSGPEIGAVLVSHSHYDHALDAPLFASAVGAPLVGTESTANIGRGAGLPEDMIKVVGDGGTIGIGRFKVTFRCSEHGPALFGRVPFPGDINRPLRQPATVGGYRMGGMFGIVVEHPSGTLVHHGSAGWRAGMYDKIHADVVLLGLAGRAGTDEYLSKVVDALGASTVIPIHFDNMFAPLDGRFRLLPGVRFAEFLDTAAATRPKLRIVTLPVGTGVKVFAV